MQYLAKLARVELGDEEAENLSHEFDAILDYVGEIKSVKITPKAADSDSGGVVLSNVFRVDTGPHAPGLYTEKLLNQAPEKEGDYIKVKRIL